MAPVEGTRRIADIAPGPPSSGFGSRLIPAGSLLFFVADDGRTGSELWALPHAVLDQQCLGDCNGDGLVMVDELIVGIDIALALTAVDRCGAFDLNDDSHVALDELVGGIDRAVRGCF